VKAGLLKDSNFRVSYVLPVIILPLALVCFPLLKGEALFWGLPVTQFLPWRAYAWQQWVGGQWPLWNPLNGMGAPLLANYQLAFFYPPGWIQYLIMAVGGTPWLAWSALLVNALHLIWAGIGMMLFQRGLGTGPFGQTISGLAFAMCGFFVARMGTSSMIWAGIWLPWVMFGGLKLVQWSKTRLKVGFPLVLTGSITMQLLAGHAQLTWYTLVLLFTWVIFLVWDSRPTKRLIKLGIGLAVSVITAVSLAAIQLLPTLEYLLQSQRSEAVDFDLGLSYSFWPWRFLSFLSPDFFGNPGQGTYFGYASYWEDAVYIGLIPLILALSTLPRLFRHIIGKEESPDQRRYPPFFWIVIIVGTILALGKNLPVFPILYKYIPSFDMFNAPARYMIWVEFSLAVLGGFAAENWARLYGKSLKVMKQITVAMAAVTLGALAAWLALSSVRITFVSATAFAGLFGLGFCLMTLVKPKDLVKHEKWQRVALAILCLDLLTNTWGLIPTTGMNLFFPEKNTEANLLDPGERLFLNAEDEYALKFSRFFRFDDFRAIEDWQNLRNVALPNINILDEISSANNFDPLLPGRYSQVMDLIKSLDEQTKLNWLKWMNVGQILNRDFRKATGVNFEKIVPWGRFRWVPCSESAESGGMAFEKIQNNLRTARNSELTVVVLEKEIQDGIAGCDSEHDVLIRPTEISSQNMKIHTESTTDGFFVIADVYYPGWEAFVNGNAVEVYKADYLFYAFRLPSGQNDIEIVYRPKWFYIGSILSGITIVIVILSVIIISRNNRKKKTVSIPGE